jgi:hypothetical protein
MENMHGIFDTIVFGLVWGVCTGLLIVALPFRIK